MSEPTGSRASAVPGGASGSVATSAPRRRMNPSARRAQIVAAARSVIERRGFGATSLRDIAAEADVSMGTVTYHFTSVDEILGAVVIAESERFYAEVVAAADAEPDPREALRLLIDPLFDEADPDIEAHWRIWTDYWAAVSRHPEMTDAYATRIRHWEQCVARIIRRGIVDGVFRDVDPESAALKLAAYSDGLATQRAQGVEHLTQPVAREWLREFADALLSPGGAPAVSRGD